MKTKLFLVTVSLNLTVIAQSQLWQNNLGQTRFFFQDLNTVQF